MIIEEIKLTLPIPPSVNKLYSTIYINSRDRRCKSREYKKWIDLSLINLKKHDTFSIKGDKWLRVRYEFYTPLYYKNKNKKKIDVFNLEKALSDFLTDHISWFQDEKIKQWFVKKIDSQDNIVKIFISEI